MTYQEMLDADLDTFNDHVDNMDPEDPDRGIAMELKAWRADAIAKTAVMADKLQNGGIPTGGLETPPPPPNP